MADPIDWPMLYHTSRDPELHEAAALYREAIGRVGVVAIEWGERPDVHHTAMRHAALTLKCAKARLEAIGARLWAEREARRP